MTIGLLNLMIVMKKNNPATKAKTGNGAGGAAGGGVCLAGIQRTQTKSDAFDLLACDRDFKL